MSHVPGVRSGWPRGQGPLAEIERTGEAVWEAGLLSWRRLWVIPVESLGGRWALRSGAQVLPAPFTWAHKCGALTTGWQVGAEVDGEPVAPAQVGIVGQRGAQAGLPTAAGVPTALLKVGHGAQVQGAGGEQLLGEHAAGLHGVGGWIQEAQGRGASGLVCLVPQAQPLPPCLHLGGLSVCVCVCTCVHI